MSPSVVVTRSKHLVRVAVAPFKQQLRLAPSIMVAAREESHKHGKWQDKVLIQKVV